MDIKVLASSSSGNSYHISDGKTHLLLDAGIQLKRIQIALHFKICQLNACFISHAHKDHSRATIALAGLGIDIYTSAGTLEACGGLKGHRFHVLQALKEVSVGSFKILPFDVQHDAPEPLGFLFSSIETDEKLLYFTDTFYLKYRFQGLTHIMAECNYDKESLEYAVAAGYVPEIVQKRIVKSHMSLENLVEMLKANDLSKVKQIYLMHLSQNNSNEKHFKTEIQKATGAEVYLC